MLETISPALRILPCFLDWQRMQLKSIEISRFRTPQNITLKRCMFQRNKLTKSWMSAKIATYQEESSVGISRLRAPYRRIPGSWPNQGLRRETPQPLTKGSPVKPIVPKGDGKASPTSPQPIAPKKVGKVVYLPVTCTCCICTGKDDKKEKALPYEVPCWEDEIKRRIR